MAMIRPETEMRDAGIDWIGNIPKNWNIKPLYACLDEINQKNSPAVTTNILSLTNTDGVIPYSERGNQGNKSKENFEEYKVVYPNTIVANSMNILIGSVGLSKYEGCVSPVYYVYMAKPQVDIRYMNYLFQMEPFQKRLRQFANGILEIRLRVSSHDILHQKVAVPDYGEQQAIADYLDETCSKIDEIIAEAKASIDEYKSLKKTMITEAVTQGIENKTETKRIGLYWCKDILADWNIKSLKHISTKTISYGVIKLFEPDDDGVKILRCSDVKEGYIDESNIRTISRELSNKYSRTILNKNDVVINVRGTLGGCAVISEKMKGFNVAREVAVISPDANEFSSRFIMYSLLSKVFDNYRDYSLSGAIYVGLNMDTLSHYKMPYPCLKIQEKIADYLDERSGNIDSIIAEKESLINDLEAYKKSLIYEVVTGKRRVV